MAVSGKTAAPIEAPYFLDGDKPPNMATVTKAQSDRLHTLLEALGMDDALDGTAGSGQILIAQPGNLSRFKAMSGDGTIDKAGALTIADGAVTSRKFKPTIGFKAITGEVTLGEEYKDLTGTEFELPKTPVKTKLLILATFYCEIQPTGGEKCGAYIEGTMSIGAVDQARRAVFRAPHGPAASWGGNPGATFSQFYLSEIPAEEAKILKMRAKYSLAENATVKALTTNTQYLYLQVAA